MSSKSHTFAHVVSRLEHQGYRNRKNAIVEKEFKSLPARGSRFLTYLLAGGRLRLCTAFRGRGGERCIGGETIVEGVEGEDSSKQRYQAHRGDELKISAKEWKDEAKEGGLRGNVMLTCGVTPDSGKEMA